MIAGDLLSALEFPFVYHSVEAYRRTLDRVAELIAEHAIDTVVPGHGPIASGRAEISRRLDDDRRYLDDLAAAVAATPSGGLEDDETLRSVTSRVAFRGMPIPAAQADFHRANVALAAREALANA